MAFEKTDLTKVYREADGTGGIGMVMLKTAGANSGVVASAGANGGLEVEFASGATAPLPTGAATEATLAAIDAKVTTVNTDAVTVAASALPTGAATQTTLADILAKIIAAPATEAKQTTLNGYVAPGTWTPATGAVPDDSGVISAAACTVRSVIASNRTATTVYLMLFDAASVPADATAPRIPFVAVPAESTIQVALGGLACSAGLCWSTSTTFGVKTIGATTPLVVSAEIV